MTAKKRSNYKNPFSATFEGISAVFKKQVKAGSISETDRLDGKTVFIDGASSGLGFAVAIRMASRGARVIMACRSGIPEKGEEVKRKSGNPDIEMVHVDYADLNSVLRLVETVKARFAPLDIAIVNAAMVPRESRRTPQGLEEMFMVNYLSKFILLNGFVEGGCFRRGSGSVPRIVIVSSESHRHPQEFDWMGFGMFRKYGMQKTVEYYGYYKLLLTTYACELSRRIHSNGNLPASVFALCPGPVNSGIAREAPGFLQPLMKAVFAIFFRSPGKASEPVIYLACSKDMEGKPFDYLFRMTRKPVDVKASDPENGKKLWEYSDRLVKDLSNP